MERLNVTEHDRALTEDAVREARPEDAAALAAEVHEDLIRSVMEEGRARRVRVRGYGTGLPYRPESGLPRD